MDIDLNYEQRGRLELIAMHAGKPVAQMLVEAAEFLIDRDPSCFEPAPSHTQRFLSYAEMEARFTRILRH